MFFLLGNGHKNFNMVIKILILLEEDNIWNFENDNDCFELALN